MLAPSASRVAQLPFSSPFGSRRIVFCSLIHPSPSRKGVPDIVSRVRSNSSGCDCKQSCSLSISSASLHNFRTFKFWSSLYLLRHHFNALWGLCSGRGGITESSFLLREVHWRDVSYCREFSTFRPRWSTYRRDKASAFRPLSKLSASPVSKIKPPDNMTTVSVAAHEGGRQLRRRKETHISVTSSHVAGGNMDGKGTRKKSKGTLTSTLTDDEMDLPSRRQESYATDFEARLWDLDKTDKLTSLTVVELRGYMKHMSKPTAGRKEDLISEVRKWLAQRQAANLTQSRRVPITRESSSDADSLEGALLKAETKSRQAEAMSRLKDNSTNLPVEPEITSKKMLVQQDAEVLKESDSLHLHNASKGTGPRKRAESAQTNSKGNKVDITDGDSEPTMEEENTAKVTLTPKAVPKRKIQSSKDNKGSKDEEQSKKRKVEEEAKISQEEAHLETADGTRNPWLLLSHKKPQKDWVVYDPTTMRSSPPPSGMKTMKLMSWNVNGLRALIKTKDKKTEETLLMTQLAKEESFDVLCLQETKLQEKDVEQIRGTILTDYADSYWSCSTAKLGYSGTAVISRIKPVSVKYGMGIADHDKEGRLITVEFDSFFLVTSYVPNSGAKLERLAYRTEEWDPALSQYLKELEKQKPVVLTGDLNCANEEIDICNPDGNHKSAGFTDEERVSFKTNFLNKGLVDSFRNQHPNTLAYTYWGYRTAARPKNQGWRLDYFLVSEKMLDRVHDSYIRPDFVGSDHCPLGLILKLQSS